MDSDGPSVFGTRKTETHSLTISLKKGMVRGPSFALNGYRKLTLRTGLEHREVTYVKESNVERAKEVARRSLIDLITRGTVPVSACSSPGAILDVMVLRAFKADDNTPGVVVGISFLMESMILVIAILDSCRTLSETLGSSSARRSKTPSRIWKRVSDHEIG